MSTFFYEDGEPKFGKFIVSGIIGLIALIVLFGSFTIISPQEVGVVTRLGSLNRTVGEGFHWKIPMVEDVTTIRLSEQKYPIKSQVYSKDGQTVSTNVIINYKVNPTSVVSLYRETKNNYEDIVINPVVSPSAEEVFSRYTAQELIEKRSSLAIDIKNKVIEKVGQRGILIVGVELLFDFDDAYEQAIRNKQVQEQQALAQVNITRQEEEKKKQEILKAEALSEKTRLEGVALQSAQGEKVIAKIYAEAALKAAEKWNGALPTQMIPGATVPFINLTK